MSTRSKRSLKAEAARRFAESAAPVIRQVQASGVASLRGIAAVLNARGVRTARGGRWAATQFGAVLARAERTIEMARSRRESSDG